MAITFELGDPQKPRGHALVFFRDSVDPSRVAASYVVALPLDVDIARYVPPFLAGQLEGLSTSDMSSFTFPPAPEPVEGGLEWVLDVARSRDDDLLDGGVASLNDATSLMGALGSIAQQYIQLCREIQPAAHEHVDTVAEKDAPGEVDDVMYDLLSEPELLRELTTLVGRLRFAVEGGDKDARDDTVGRIRAIGRRMPENRRIDQLCDAASGNDVNSARVAQLYLDRAYALQAEDYLRVREVEKRIADLIPPSGPESVP